jgi:tetratricopeptide (TPR) repeat protein
MMSDKSDANRTPDNYLLYWRKRKNVPLKALSARIEGAGRHFVSTNTLNRWEKGQTSLQEWAIPEIASALKITEAELLYGPKEGDSSLPENVSAAFTGLDGDLAERVITMGYTSWLASRPDDARHAVDSVLPWLEAAQRRAPQATHAKQGLRLLSRGYELLGALALDRLENDAAISRFRQALTISEELRDTNLIAAHMTELGDAYRRKGDTRTALALMETALSKTTHGERATRGYVLEMLAYTYTDTRDEAAFLRNIEEATDLLGHTGEGEDGSAKREFIPFEVLEIHGKSLREFGHASLALDYYQRAEQSLMSRPSMPRWHALLTISKAQALCDAGELDEGIRLAIQGITLAHACQSPRQMNRVRKLMLKLDSSHYAAAPQLTPLRDIVRQIYSGDRSPLDWQPQHAM